jgi:copper chaperone CopZ
MDFNKTIDIIIKDLREAREIIDDLKNYPGVPQLQIELIKSKCKSAEEIIALLKTMKFDNQSASDQQIEDVRVIQLSESEAKEPLIEISDDDEGESESEPDSLSVDYEKVSEITDKKPIEKSGNESGVVIQGKVKDKLPNSNTVADLFGPVSNSYYEQLADKQNDVDISSVIKSVPVTDLTEAIGINDKFLFIKVIFNGNQESYNEAISKLNKAANLSDAKAIIMSYTGEGEENEAVKQLLDLVKRKLPADE